MEVAECHALDAALVQGPFDLALGELSPPLGIEATLAELRAVRNSLAPGGKALVLGLRKQWREFLRDASGELGITGHRTRGDVALFELHCEELINGV